MRSAKSACLNSAEGADRVTRADKARAFAIARGEAAEAVAAVEIAAQAGDTTAEAAQRCLLIGDRLVALLTGLGLTRGSPPAATLLAVVGHRPALLCP